MSNNLINEESPYLQQHANNPVNWYPWSKEAFERAKEEDKAIFLSIGYSSCHWCHVMERESFENEEFANILNKHFIAIKVDREERPDIDKHFQEVFVTMNGRAGGWPLSIFMTPGKTPFYSATYIPPEPRYGMLGFGELLETIAIKYQKDRKTLEKKGQEVLDFLKPKSKIQATKIDKNLEITIIKQIKQLFEPKFGGFSGAPKFPHASTLRLALALYQLKADEELKSIIEHTLKMMSLGGLYDLVDGGFCRYSTDEAWLVPHFEKMTYDNALLAEVYLKAGLLFNNDRFRQIAYETLDFMIDKMMDSELFFSASDADSQGEEGSYFVYSYDEALKALKEANFTNPKELLKSLGVSKEGNFFGKNIIRLQNFSDFSNVSIQEALKVLKSLREAREYPFIDRKIQTSWNAMVIGSLFIAGRYKRRYLTQAIKSLEALENKMADGVGLYHSTLIDNRPKVEGFLEDYAWLITALLEGYRATLDENYLKRATKLSNEAIKRFYDGGRWRIDNQEFKELCDDRDSSYPSALSVMVEALLGIESLVDPVYEKFISRTLEVHSYNLMRQPISRPTLTEVTIRDLKDDLIIKSKQKNLKPYISKIDTIGYPWLWFKGSFDDNFMLCGKRSCFASEDSFESIKKAVKSYKIKIGEE